MYWHGGGRIPGNMILTGDESGNSRSGDGGFVFVTTDRSLATMYASTVDEPTAWVYEVEPLGDVEPVPPLVGGPVISFRCARARIIRRFTVDKATRARARESVNRMASSPMPRLLLAGEDL